MSEPKDKEKSTDTPGKLSLGGKGTLSLKGGLSAPPRPSMGHGGVAVEVRRKRTPVHGEQPARQEDANLNDAQKEARAAALRNALSDPGATKSRLPNRRTIEDIKREEAAGAQAAQGGREKELEELKRIEQLERGGLPGAEPGATPYRPNATLLRRPGGEDEESESYRDRMKKAANKTPQKTTDDRRGGRITVTQAINQEFERDRVKSLAAQKRAREKARLAALGPKVAPTKIIREVVLPEVITVQELSNRMAEPGSDVIKALMKMGVMATINQSIDADTAELIATEFGHKIKRVTEGDVEIGLEGDSDNETNLQSRPPVVTIMGHVDHGKTSLLDALRSTDVVSGEAGGITQHIGAYQVTLPSGAKITFLDTPGHAAFTEMRARGANVTDIVVIVVSAEDSIMPQTIEAISHARAANVPIIIAINKIDMPNANPGKVKQDLLQHEVVVEDMGGDTICVEVSAKKKTNLDKLEEMILLQAEVLELKANPNREAQGVVIESKVERGRGTVITALIQKGTLKIGDIFVAGAEYGKVKAIVDDRGNNIKEAGPGLPVEVLGLNATPEAGDVLSVVNDDRKASEVSSYRQAKRRELQAVAAVKGRTTMEQLLAQKAEGEKTTLPVIVKADVHGSVEAIIGSLNKMASENEGVAVLVLHSGVGGITESDVTLARASGGVIIGFNVRANAQARDLAQKEGVNIRYYNIIYNVIDDAKAILTGMLSPTEREEYLGQAEIREVFNITKVGKVAGCYVTTGNVKRGAKVRLLRDSVVIHEGKLKTLKRFKDEVKEVKEGTECGMAFENYDDMKAGDIIECYEVIAEARTVT